MTRSRITLLLMAALWDALTVTSHALFHVSLTTSKDKGEGDSELCAFKISSDGEKNEVLREQRIH